MKSTDSTIYSGVPCNECGGPTYRMRSGSIWCSAEDPHPGGHFVVRVAFERKPGTLTNAELRQQAPVIKSRGIKPQTSATVSKVSAPKPAFGGGYDDFVRGDGK